MPLRRSVGERIFDAGNVLLMILMSLVTIYPFLYVLFGSVSDPVSFMQYRGILLKPLGFTIESYKMVFKNPMVAIGYLNTLFYVGIGTALNLLMTALGAYCLSRQGVLWRNHIMMFIVITMFFSGGLVPTYLLMNDLGLMDSRWALILPSAMSAYNMIIMRTAFQAVPVSLEESARLEGAGELTILFRVVLPLSLPVLAVMVLFYGVAHWNAWFAAMIYLRTRDLWPLQLVLREILIQNATDSMMTSVGGGDRMPIGETIKYATIIVATVPILLWYPFLQKYFVKGVMIGAVKE